MSGIADIITKLYKRFFLRDLLSYVCPGLIVITSIIIIPEQKKILDFFKEINIGFGEAILVFLFSYVIGLSINGLIESIRLFRDITKDEPNSMERVNYYLRRINLERIQGKITFVRGEKGKVVKEKIQNFSYYIEQRDRYIILKQMSRNNMGAVSISFILYLINNFNLQCNTALHYLGFLLLAGGLFVSACKSYRHHTDFEYALNKCYNEDGVSEELIENGKTKTKIE